MATFNFVTRASAQIKRDSSRLVKEFIPKAMTETTRISTLQTAFSVADASNWPLCCQMLRKLPLNRLSQMTDLIQDLDLTVLKVSRVKDYVPPINSFVFAYRAVRDSRGAIIDFKVFDEYPILL